MDNIQIAQTTLKACEDGYYINNYGQQVLLDREISYAKLHSALYDLEMCPRVPNQKHKNMGISVQPMSSQSSTSKP